MRLKCPRCGSTNLTAGNTKKKFSVGKAVVGNTVGGLLLGPLGAAVGTANGIHGKNGKTTFVCCSCGKVFEKKL